MVRVLAGARGSADALRAGGAGAAAGTDDVSTAWLRRPVVIAVAAVLVVLCVGVSLLQLNHFAGIGPELALMVALTVVASQFASGADTSFESVLEMNPAVCFSFAILLSWGLVAAIVAQVAAVAMLTWRRHLPPLRGVLKAGQFVVAFAGANAVLSMGDPRAEAMGRTWADLGDAAVVVGAIVAWLAVFVAVGYLIERGGVRLPRSSMPKDVGVGYQLLFMAALLVLSPVLAVAAEVNVAFLPLLLIPLTAVQRMARLSAERERANRLDPLTSLANRSMLQERFDTLAADCDHATHMHRGQHVVLLLLDLDRFKHVNDSLGHEVGDQLLTVVAARLATVDDEAVLAGRLGGDEFAILTCVDNVDAARDLAERVAALVRQPVRLDGLSVDVSASIGVALRQQSGDDFAAMLRHADTAMYDAKRQKDSVAVHDPNPDGTIPDRLRLLADFRDALQTGQVGEITLHYQPQARLDTGAIEAVEALLRWAHPGHGPIDPHTVLDVIEHTSVMHLLTTRVLDDATAQLAAWRGDGVTCRVSVNISARDLYSDDIVAHIADRLEHHHIPAHQLQVEITESALIADPTRARTTLRRIADLGVDVSLDDFGTGYSSLQHLRRLPLAEIKVDRSFVAGMLTNHDDAAIVTSTVNMAHALGLRTVAEGVADEPTRRMLMRIGCDLGQGWHLGHPSPAGLIPTLLTTSPAT